MDSMRKTALAVGVLKGFDREAWAGRGGDIDRSPVPGALPARAAL